MLGEYMTQRTLGNPERNAGNGALTPLSFFHNVYGVESPVELAQLRPRTVTMRLLAVKHTRIMPAADTSVIPKPTRTPLGEIAEGDTIVHVVFRTRYDGRVHAFRENARDVVDVMTVRRTPEGWRALLNGGLIYGGGGSVSVGYSLPLRPNVVVPP